MSTRAELSSRFSGKDFLSFSELAPDFVVAHVKTAWSTASVALQGAHVLTWKPASHKPVIWLSKAAKFAPGKSIRGGIPLCWPWFGPHATEPGWPGHGFARTIPWSLLDARQLPDGRVCLEFAPEVSDTNRTYWPHASTVRYTITVGQELEVDLATTNNGATPFTLGQALHTYFEIGDICQTRIAGLDGCRFIDKFDGSKRKKQEGAISFTGETDRVYLGTRGCCGIIDPVFKRTILVTSTGSGSTVVWNPWAEKAARMGDLGRNGELRMVCVETANAADDVVTLPPGDTHRLNAQYRVIRH